VCPNSALYSLKLCLATSSCGVKLAPSKSHAPISTSASLSPSTSPPPPQTGAPSLPSRVVPPTSTKESAAESRGVAAADTAPRSLALSPVRAAAAWLCQLPGGMIQLPGGMMPCSRSFDVTARRCCSCPSVSGLSASCKCARVRGRAQTGRRGSELMSTCCRKHLWNTSTATYQTHRE